MKLTVWDDMVSKFERGKSYRIKQLSTRLFNNVKALTSTKTTSSELIEDTVNCVEPADELGVVEKEGKITQVCLVMYFTCEICKEKVSLPDDDTKFVRCSSCKMNMAKESLQKSINGTLYFLFLLWLRQSEIVYFLLNIVHHGHCKPA